MTGAGSAWNASGSISVGKGGSSNLLFITEGGNVLGGYNGYVGFDEASSNNTVIVAGQSAGPSGTSTSAWYIGGVELSVGEKGSSNQLIIARGGLVTCLDGYLGNSGDSQNNSALVGGAGSRWESGQGLYVGLYSSGNILTITNGGVVKAGFASVGAGGPNNGIVAGGSGSLLEVDGTLGVRSGANRLVITAGGTVSVSGKAAISGPGAALSMDGGSLVAAGGVQIANGAFLVGTGKVVGKVTNDGTVSPGHSVGTVSITGDYSQNSDGELDMELGGLAGGSQFDQLNVTGTATMDGTLNVTFINGFLPKAGDAFSIITYGSHSGAFAAVRGLRAPNGLLLTAQYNSTNLTLVATNEFKLQSVRVSGTNISFGLSTVTGSTYVVEYTGSLSPPDWHTLQTVVGDGTMHTITEAIIAGTERYYRVRVQ